MSECQSCHNRGGPVYTPNSIVYGSLLALVLAAKFLLSDWDEVVCIPRGATKHGNPLPKEVSLSLDIIYQHVTVSLSLELFYWLLSL